MSSNVNGSGNNRFYNWATLGLGLVGGAGVFALSYSMTSREINKEVKYFKDRLASLQAETALSANERISKLRESAVKEIVDNNVMVGAFARVDKQKPSFQAVFVSTRETLDNAGSLTDTNELFRVVKGPNNHVVGMIMHKKPDLIDKLFNTQLFFRYCMQYNDAATCLRAFSSSSEQLPGIMKIDANGDYQKIHELTAGAKKELIKHNLRVLKSVGSQKNEAESGEHEQIIVQSNNRLHPSQSLREPNEVLRVVKDYRTNQTVSVTWHKRAAPLNRLQRYFEECLQQRPTTSEIDYQCVRDLVKDLPKDRHIVQPSQQDPESSGEEVF